MSRFDKLLLKLLDGAADASLAFDDLRYGLERLGFDERIRGSHHIFDRDGIPKLVNIQRYGQGCRTLSGAGCPQPDHPLRSRGRTG